jgi:hypothetical protein
MRKYIITLSVLLFFVAWDVWAQSSRAPGSMTMPTATITALTVGTGGVTFPSGESLDVRADGIYDWATDEALTVTAMLLLPVFMTLAVLAVSK